MSNYFTCSSKFTRCLLFDIFSILNFKEKIFLVRILLPVWHRGMGMCMIYGAN